MSLSTLKYRIFRRSIIILYISCFLFLSPDILVSQSRVPKIHDGINAYMSGDYAESFIQYYSFYKSKPELDKKEMYSLMLRLSFIASWSQIDNAALDFLNMADSLENSGVLPDSTALSDRYLVNAILEYNKGNYAETANLLTESVQYRTILDDFEKSILANTYGFRGLVYRYLEDYETAIKYYNEAIRLDRELGRDFVIAIELSELAAARSDLNPFDKRIEEELQEALEIFISSGDKSYEASVYNEYGKVYWIRGNLPKALESLVKCAGIKEKYDLQSNLDRTFNNIGALYEAMHQTDSSIFYIRKAIQVAEEEEIETGGQYLYNIGTRFGKLGIKDSALQYFDLAIKKLIPDFNLQDAKSNPYLRIDPRLPVYLAGSATELYQYYKDKGDLNKLLQSIKTYEIALHQLDTLRFLHSFDSKTHAVKDNRKYYFYALQYATEYFEQTKNPEDKERAFALASQSKSSVFDEYLRINEARVFLDINPDLLRKDDSLKLLKTSMLQKTYEINGITPVNQDSLSKYNTAIFNIDEEINFLSNEIKKTNSSYYKAIHTIPSYSSDRIRELLSQNEIIIDYTWFENQMIISLVSKDEFHLQRINADSNLRHLINEYRRFIQGDNSQMDYDDFVSQSYNFFSSLIEPFKHAIEGKTLYIIPDDSLAMLPFESLLSKELKDPEIPYSKLPYLIRENPVSYYHSLQQFVLSKEAGELSFSGVSAFAPFDKDDYTDGTVNLEKLEGSLEEVKSIKDQLPSRIFISREASENIFRNHLKRDRVIHLATHGLQADSTPLQNHLLFYPGKRDADFKFHLFELHGMQVESPLVVLSACNTGTGTYQPGEGILSLARAFHFAGTPSLLMSQWPVDDQAAIYIMDQFYAGIKDGLSLCKALQMAKLNYLQTAGKIRSNPYYWASFQLTGYSDHLILSKSWKNSIIAVIGGIAFLLIIILLTARRYLIRKVK